MRAPSSGNLSNARPAANDPYNYRKDDPRSKSTSNLHVDTNLDRAELHSNMKPAQSVGMLHPSSPGYGQYSPGGRRLDVRPNDYENQPTYPKVGGEGQGKPGYNFVDPRQNIPGQPKPQNQFQSPGYVQQKNSDRSSISSKTSSNSNRDSRPQSAYYDPHNANRDNSDFVSRPKSEDVGSKLKEWQDKYEDPRGGYNKQPGRGQSPPYSNIGAQNREPPPQPQHNPPPKPTAHERLFSQQGMPQKANNSAYNRQPNFYENTVPLKQEPPPAFHQLARLPIDNDLKPRPGPKPALIKKNQPRVQHADLPMVRVDNRQTQPHFYGDNRSTVSLDQASSPQSTGYLQPSGPQYDARNAPPQASRIPAQPDYRNDSRFDLQLAPDPKNGPVQDYRNTTDPRNIPDMRSAPDLRSIPDMRNAPDPRNIPDLRNAPDARNMQQYGNDINYSQQPDYRNSTNNLPSPIYQDQNRSLPPTNQHFQQQRYPEPVNSYGYPSNSHDTPPPPLHPSNTHLGSYQDNFEEPPILPPPPSNEALLEQKLAEEQQKLLQTINATNQFLADRYILISCKLIFPCIIKFHLFFLDSHFTL